MADGDEGQERTEDPTDKKKEDAREKGQVPLSRDTTTVLVFLAAVGVFVLFRHSILDGMCRCMTHFLQFGYYPQMGLWDVQRVLWQAGWFTLKALMPLLLAVFIVSVGANLIQFGFVYSPQKIEIRPDRLDPVAGFRRVFSLRQAIEGLKSVVKVTLIGTIIYFVVRSHLARIESLVDMSPRAMLEDTIWSALSMTWKASIFLVVLAILDFAYQRWEYARGLRMTRQELKDEMKEREGDPLIKQRIRQIQMERARQRMMSEVPKSNVVITNPTHLAIALRYDRQTMNAPRVVAKGAGYIAEKIRKLAEQHEIPTVENKPVAQILYRAVKVGGEVPMALYKAIASILAYVYKTAKKKPNWL